MLFRNDTKCTPHTKFIVNYVGHVTSTPLSFPLYNGTVKSRMIEKSICLFHKTGTTSPKENVKYHSSKIGNLVLVAKMEVLASKFNELKLEELTRGGCSDGKHPPIPTLRLWVQVTKGAK